MLFKLSLKNIRRSIRDYAIYFFTLIIGVSIFYVFNAIDEQSVMMQLSGELGRMMKLTNAALLGISVFVALVLGLLIVYANRFLMKRRNKEFALYLLLGMSKRDTSALLLLENIIVGIGSLAVGLVVGVAFSQLTSALIANIFGVDMSAYKFVVSVSAIRRTIIFFALIYIFVILSSSRFVGKMKLIDLIHSGKKSERVRVKNPVLSILLFIFSAAVLGVDYYLVTNSGLNVLNGPSITAYILVGIAATFLIFMSLSGLLLNIFKSMKKTYYKELNSFTFRQISSKVNSTFSSISIICLMLFFTICSLSTAFSIRGGLNDNMESQCPADFAIRHQVYFDNFRDLIHDDIAARYEIYGYDLTENFKEYVHFHSYADPSFTMSAALGKYIDNALEVNSYLDVKAPQEIVRLSDYNELMSLYGRESVTLGANEYVIVCNFKTSKAFYDLALGDGKEITIFGHKLMPRYDKTVDGFIEISSTKSNTGVYIVPDSAVDESGAATDYFIGNYNAATDEQRRAIEEKCCAEHDEVNRLMGADQETGAMPYQFYMQQNTRIDLMENSIGVGALVTFVCLYLGIIFLIACGAILALRELSDSVDSIERYDILRKIGADERDISRSLRRQIGIFFLLPLILAVIHSIFGMKFAMEIINLFGASGIAEAIAATSAVILLIYGGYFLITYLCSRNIIKNRS